MKVICRFTSIFTSITFRCIQANEKIGTLQDEIEKERRRENFATLRLAVKEKLTTELMEEVESVRKSCADERRADRMMMDHFTGQVFQAMRDKLRQYRKELKLLRLELDAARNGSESTEVRKLVKKCEKLEQLYGTCNSDQQKITRLEVLLAYANKTIEKLRRRQRDLNELFVDHDAEVSKLQSELAHLKEENRRLLEGHELERENLVMSRIGKHLEDADFDLVDNSGDEMESVSSGELNEKKEKTKAPGSATPERRDVDAVKVSSSGSEPDDAVVISSPEAGGGGSGPGSD
ncbi:unnamed protein product [Enterobius vermicularis]|uniref:Uncharacterized protein n=1 Tax=Enterobius vermicularis TaxID=51028 RepID=A0A3P6IPJ4_ENTVE|nr:unnamed protein product [Enterobius vermicularis]